MDILLHFMILQCGFKTTRCREPMFVLCNVFQKIYIYKELQLMCVSFCRLFVSFKLHAVSITRRFQYMPFPVSRYPPFPLHAHSAFPI